MPVIFKRLVLLVRAHIESVELASSGTGYFDSYAFNMGIVIYSK